MDKETALRRIAQDKDWRQRLDAILQEMKEATAGTQPPIENDTKFTGGSRHRSLSITHTEDAIMRLGMDLKEVNEQQPGAAPNPYPQSYDKNSPVVEPTADGLKL